MNIMTTRTAPAGARFSRPSASHLATVDTMLARAAAFGGSGRMTASASDIAPTDPAPPAPSTPADTAARLDAQDAQLADHEARISGLEQRTPAAPENAVGTQASAPVAIATAMVDSRAIYAKMNARPGGLKAATPAASAVIQTSAGPIVNARAIHDRNNAAVAARADRGTHT